MSDESEGFAGTEIEEGAAETALVEVAPGAALVFGRVPDGFDLIPFRLVPPSDQLSISSALAASSSILNVGSQLAPALAQAQGLVRLAPETLRAMQAGATPIQSGNYFLGTLRVGNQFSNSVRWMPAGGLQAAGVMAAIGPAIAMIAIQVQLNEVAGLVRQNIALTETVLKSVRNEQWAELTGLEQTVTKALNEASAVGEVTPLLWENIAGSEAAIGKQRDLFRRNVQTHAEELGKRTGHTERRQYIEKNGEALVLDLHCLLLAHKSWFEYQALRAGRAKLEAGKDPREAKLVDIIIENAKNEYDEVADELGGVLDTVNRELSILAELPGKWTIPFTSARRSAADVANMSKQLLAAVQRLSDSVRPQPEPLQPPSTISVEEAGSLEQDLRILRWQLDGDERLLAIATASDPPVGAFAAVGNMGKRRLESVTAFAEAALRRKDMLEAASAGYEHDDTLIALTQKRVVVAGLDEFRNQGEIRRSIPSEDIRYVRFRAAEPAGRAEIDLIAKDQNHSWRFGKGSASKDSVKELGALLADHMNVPDAERSALLAALPAAESEFASRQLTALETSVSHHAEGPQQPQHSDIPS